MTKVPDGQSCSEGRITIAKLNKECTARIWQGLGQVADRAEGERVAWQFCL